MLKVDYAPALDHEKMHNCGVSHLSLCGIFDTEGMYRLDHAENFTAAAE
jgi:hypothetical protein